MKGKNKKLIVIVSCLLLVGGVSFAYFLASTLFSGEGSSVSGTTATINDAELRVEGTLEFNDLDIYPGHQNVSSVKVTATGDNTLIPYNLVWNGTNTLNTSLNYTVYKTSSEVEVNATCEKTKGVVSGALMYYEECSISNLEQLGTAISTGTINTNDTKVILAEDEFITASPTGLVQYYYLVLEYPNLDESQNSDIGGSFSGEVSVEESDAEPDINIIAAYIKQEDGSYEEVSDIPQKGYTLNTEKSVCSNGASVRWDIINSELITSNLTKSGTSCYLYFDEFTTGEMLLANYQTRLTRSSFTSTVTDTTTGTIYYEDTSKGTTYYFAGSPTDNWVQFGGFYWRIIRINEDGTVRMIYQGTSANTTGDETKIGTSDFNSSYRDNMYVGYMYTSNQVHGLTSASTIKGILDRWYQNNLTGVSDKIDGNAGFCGDRTPYTNTSGTVSGGGTSTVATYYEGYINLVTNKVPTFDCLNEDLYTTSGSSDGNGALTYPIGLISADEVAFAGGVVGITNENYFLNISRVYWTMSPSWFEGSWAYVFFVDPGGPLNNEFDVNNEFGVRPVINLKADVSIQSGTGTAQDPYII